MNETTDRDTDHDAKRQTQHMANVLRADTMHVAVVHQTHIFDEVSGFLSPDISVESVT